MSAAAQAREGGCLCGAVRYRVAGALRAGRHAATARSAGA